MNRQPWETSRQKDGGGARRGRAGQPARRQLTVLARAGVAVLTACLAVVGLAMPAASAAAPHEVSGKKFVIGTDTTFAPFEFRDPSGELTGIDMDLIRDIAKRGGFEVEIKSLGFNAALQALSSNQVDGVIAGMSITDKRKQVYDFSDPYFESGVQMAVAKCNNDIKGYVDLKG